MKGRRTGHADHPRPSRNGARSRRARTGQRENPRNPQPHPRPDHTRNQTYPPSTTTPASSTHLETPRRNIETHPRKRRRTNTRYPAHSPAPPVRPRRRQCTERMPVRSRDFTNQSQRNRQILVDTPEHYEYLTVHCSGPRSARITQRLRCRVLSRSQFSWGPSSVATSWATSGHDHPRRCTSAVQPLLFAKRAAGSSDRG